MSHAVTNPDSTRKQNVYSTVLLTLAWHAYSLRNEEVVNFLLYGHDSVANLFLPDQHFFIVQWHKFSDNVSYNTCRLYTSVMILSSQGEPERAAH